MYQLAKETNKKKAPPSSKAVSDLEKRSEDLELAPGIETLEPPSSQVSSGGAATIASTKAISPSEKEGKRHKDGKGKKSTLVTPVTPKAAGEKKQKSRKKNHQHDSGALVLDGETVTPGAQHIPGPTSHLVGACIEEDPEQGQGEREEEAHGGNEHIVSAILVEDDNGGGGSDDGKKAPPLATAAPWTGYWTRRRIGIAILIIVLAAVVTALIVAFMDQGSDKKSTTSLVDDDRTPVPTVSPTTASPTPFPTWSPTSHPTIHPRQWMKIADLNPFYSEDEFGESVAISKHGTKLLVGAIGYDEGSSDGRADLFWYEDGIWRKKGNIYGYGQDGLGQSSSISEDGTIVAVGAPFRVVEDSWWEPAEPHEGKVRVYRGELDHGTGKLVFVQLGTDIVGNNTLDHFGWNVELSDNGSVLAAGDLTTCLVRVFEYVGDDWIPLGGKGIECEKLSYYGDPDYAASSMSLSRVGYTIAVGTPGLVRVYKYDQSMLSWIQVGQNLMVEEEDSQYAGLSVSLSDDGSTVAVGDPGAGGWVPGTCTRREYGIAQILSFNNVSEQWEQLGQDLVGEADFDKFGAGISLSSDGSVVAIGATRNNDNGEDSGHIRVFRYDDESSTWILVGGDSIKGPLPRAEAGGAIAISADGSRVCYGVTPDHTSDLVGYAQVFETGIYVAGSFTVSIGGNNLYMPMRWSLERLDVAAQERAFVAHNVEVGGSYGSNPEWTIETLNVPLGGLYKFSLIDFEWHYEWEYDCYEDATYFIRSGINGTGETLAQGFSNFNAITNAFFVAGTPIPNFTDIGIGAKALDQPTAAEDVGGYHLNLEITFGNRPQDVQWVLVARDYVIMSGRTLHQDKVIAFCDEYFPASANHRIIETIDISFLISNSSDMLKFTLLFTEELSEDDSYSEVSLFNGTETNDSRSLLLFIDSSSQDRKRKAIHTFSFFA